MQQQVQGWEGKEAVCTAVGQPPRANGRKHDLAAQSPQAQLIHARLRLTLTVCLTGMT